MLGSGVSPGNSVVWLGVEKGVCDAQVAVRTQLRETLSVLVELATPKYPMQRGQELWSSPTRALKSPSRSKVLFLWLFL